ncbi:MAG: DUF429 domain-containing protein [Gammaproteobacteria bacterium]
MSKPRTAIGVDGCRAGWFYVRRRGGVIDHGVTHDLALLLEEEQPVKIAIDIPIGLRERSGQMRHCDRDARLLLGPKRSSVFAPPLRGTLAFETHAAASAWQKKRCGKGLSIQSFNIGGKIAQVDALLAANSRARAALIEAHPELCFFGLNALQPVLAKKNTDEGANARMTLLNRVMPEATRVLDEALANHRRKDVARDDIIDALVTAHVAGLTTEQRLDIPLETELDARGLPMRMTFGVAAAVKKKTRQVLIDAAASATTEQ